MRVLHTFPGVLVPIDHRHSVLASLGPRLQRSSAKCSLRKTDQGIPRGCSSKCNFAGCKAQVGALSTAFIEVLQVMPKNGSMMVHLVASVPSPTYTISAGTPSHRHVAKVQAQPSLHLQVDTLITTSSTSEAAHLKQPALTAQAAFAPRSPLGVLCAKCASRSSHTSSSRLWWHPGHGRGRQWSRGIGPMLAQADTPPLLGAMMNTGKHVFALPQDRYHCEAPGAPCLSPQLLTQQAAAVGRLRVQFALLRHVTATAASHCEKFPRGGSIGHSYVAKGPF